MWLDRNILSLLVPAHQALPGLWQEPESKVCLCIHHSYIDFGVFRHVWHESSSEMRWQTFRMTFISAITRITQWKYFPDTDQMQCYDIEGLIVSGKQGSEIYFCRIFKTKVALKWNLKTTQTASAGSVFVCWLKSSNVTTHFLIFLFLFFQVFVCNSAKYSDLGQPFGYLKASTALNCVNLFVMPYNYPVLLPLLGKTCASTSFLLSL